MTSTNNEYKIAVLLPTRARTTALKFSIISIFNRVLDLDSILIISITENCFKILNCLYQYLHHNHLHFPFCSIFFAFQLKSILLLFKADPHLFLKKVLNFLYIFQFIHAIFLPLLFLFPFEEFLSLTLITIFSFDFEQFI